MHQITTAPLQRPPQQIAALHSPSAWEATRTPSQQIDRSNRHAFTAAPPRGLGGLGGGSTGPLPSSPPDFVRIASSKSVSQQTSSLDR